MLRPSTAALLLGILTLACGGLVAQTTETSRPEIQAKAIDNQLQSPVPEGFILSSNSPVADPSNEMADNVGAPLEVLADYYAQTGANVTGIGYGWNSVEPEPPVDGVHHYVWPEMKGPFFEIEGLRKMCSFDTRNDWAKELRKTDKEKYWEHLEAFVEAAARHARENYGAVYFRVPGNEPSLMSVTPNPIYKPEYPDWHFYYMDRAIHVARGIKAANPDNKVMFGQLVVGDRARIGALAQAGLKDNLELFDILDIHAYSQNPDIHVDMYQIMESRQVLDEIGAEHIQIYMGEGWSCFPLPKHIDGNLSEEPDYRPEDVQHYRECLFSGWYHLMTPRPGEYDPSWIAGANYFTFCDLLEGRGWRRRAVPQYNDKGEVDHYLVDGYYKRPDELGPFYRPWGLITIEGEPKGQLHLEFPPYIPKHEFVARFLGNPDIKEVEAGKSYDVVVEFTNQEEMPVEATFNLISVRKGKDYGELQIAPPPVDAGPAKLATGKMGGMVFSVVFPENLKGKVSRFHGECNFTWDGKDYRVYAWGPKVTVK